MEVIKLSDSGTMVVIRVKVWSEIPKNFTGIIEWSDGKEKWWFKNGKFHREDGPAAIFGWKEPSWCLNGEHYESKEAWFQALTPEQQFNSLWNMDLWR